MKKIIFKIVIYMLCIFLIISYFLFDVYKINDISYTLNEGLKGHWYFILGLFVPILLAVSEGFLKNDVRCISNILLVILGLVVCLMSFVDNSIIQYGLYINMGVYFVLAIISGIRISKSKKNLMERQKSLNEEESKKMVEELMKNDKFKK